MSRSQASGLSRHAVDGSYANAATKEQQPRRTPGASDVVTPAPVSNQALGEALGSGAPLDPAVRAEMESRFGADFGAVRIHDEPSAHGAAQQHRAQAFTVGDHIAFNSGRYEPGRLDGKHLLAHELAHVVQQRRGGTELPRAGGGLERAAEQAASSLVASSGSVQVAGASAVGVARQPLPDEQAVDLPPPPRSLSGSLAKDEKHLKEPALEYEMGLIENYLDLLPTIPEREHLLSEYKALFRERLARRKKEPAQFPWPKAEDVSREVQEAHRHWLLTGEIPQTRWPFSWAEIKVGKPMTRSERYDFMLKLQNRSEPVTVGDLTDDRVYPGEGARDPEFLTHQEFEDEFYERFRKAAAACSSGITRPDVRDRCLHDLKGKWGGPGFRAAREEAYQRTYALWVHAQAQIESMKSGGITSLGGRVAGYALGKATGNDPLRWSEHGAALGGMVGMGGTMYIGSIQRTPLDSYTGGGGMQVGRDADIHFMESRPYGPSPARPSSSSAGAASQPAPIPISSGKGLPQSDASKALAANLAKQSPAQAGSVTPLPVKKPQASPPTEAAQQAVPAVAAVEEKIAVGQTHGPGAAAKTPAKTSLQVMQGGSQPVVASLKKQPSSNQSKTPVTAPVRTAASAGAKSGAASAKVGSKLPPLNPPGGRGSNTEPLVAVRMAGGGSAKKGTFFVEGTAEFDKANGDKSFSVMPRSQALALKYRPAGTPFDPTIEPLKIGGVQVESNAAGEGKGSKHNIAARADIQGTEDARQATYKKTIGAATAEGHGQKHLIGLGEVVIQRPGNASTGGVDSMTADVGRTPPGQPAPAGKAVPRVFLNDFTGPETTKGSKPTQANWVLELRDSVANPKFGFGNAQFDEAVYEAIQKGEVYVRTVRVETSEKGTTVTVESAEPIAVPPAVKAAVTKARRARGQ